MIPGAEPMVLIQRARELDPATGRPGKVTENPVNILCSFQPAPGEVVERLEGGYRAEDVRVAYTYVRVRLVKPGVHEADQLEFDDGDGVERWEAQEVSRWLALPQVAHYESVFVRVGEFVGGAD